jgi:hypothetical protein
MLPLGLEKSYTRVLLYAGALNLLVAASLGLRFAHIGMAWTVVGSETFIAIASYIMLRRRGLDLAFHGGIELDRRESIVDRIQELQIAPEATNGRS